ncbi:MAG: NnrS family protein [Leptospiraceae bacterium]|nr:NnrS family protein [Leptospiraceae bacterium]
MKILYSGHPFWFTAFRPFFLLASLQFALFLILWVFNYTQFLRLEVLHSGLVWHMHEMIFGFARAVIIGFLFTAAQNWTGKKLLNGRMLQLFVILWISGRTAFFIPGFLIYLALAADTVLNFTAVYLLVKFLFTPGQKHNRIIALLFAYFSAVQLIVQAALLNYLVPEKIIHLMHMGLLVVVLYVMIIAGRVVPFFTGVVLPEAGTRRVDLLEKNIMWLSLPIPILELSEVGAFAGGWIAAGYLILLAGLHAIRWFFWHPWKTLSKPILFILHISYLWVPVSLVAYALFMLKIATPGIVWHSFGLGVIAMFILGMMTRVSLGHTGRPIVASKNVMLAYFLLGSAVLIRVSVSFWSNVNFGYLVSGVLASIAFLIFFIEYVPVLVSARPDGKQI